MLMKMIKFKEKDECIKLLKLNKHIFQTLLLLENVVKKVFTRLV